MYTVKDIVHEIIQIEKDADTWDEPPAMFIITPPIAPEDRPVVQVVILHMEFPLHSLLHMMGDVFLDPEKTKDAPKLERGLLGVAVRWEAWGMKLASKEALDEFLAAGRSAGDHPGGIEILGVLGVDTDGTYSAGFERGSDADLFEDGDGHEAIADGRLVDALQHLFEGLQAHSIRSQNKAV